MRFVGTDSIEYDCEGCGVHVVSFSIHEPLQGVREGIQHGFCVTCAWLSENLDPEEIMAALRRCEAMGHPKAP